MDSVEGNTPSHPKKLNVRKRTLEIIVEMFKYLECEQNRQQQSQGEWIGIPIAKGHRAQQKKSELSHQG
jgi:hypothetical protein